MSHRPFGPALLLVSLLVLAAVSCTKDKATNPTEAGKELDSPFLLGATQGSVTYVHTFASFGTFPYHCSLHTNANHREGGTVVVSDQGGPDSVYVRIFEGEYHPASVAIRTGGRVCWQNFDDGTHHTVTSD